MEKDIQESSIMPLSSDMSPDRYENDHSCFEFNKNENSEGYELTFIEFIELCGLFLKNDL